MAKNALLEQSFKEQVRQCQPLSKNMAPHATQNKIQQPGVAACQTGQYLPLAFVSFSTSTHSDLTALLPFHNSTVQAGPCFPALKSLLLPLSPLPIRHSSVLLILCLNATFPGSVVLNTPWTLTSSLTLYYFMLYEGLPTF